MNAIYGHRWASAFGVQPQDEAGKITLAGDTWGRALAGISEHQIAQGLNACIMRGGDDSEVGWPPVAPQFKRMCLGIPTLAEVRFDMRSKTTERKPFTVLVWSYIDSHRYRQADAVLSDRMLRDAYELACEAVLRGEPLPECAGSIEPPKEAPIKPASPEVVAAHLSRLSKILGAEE